MIAKLRVFSMLCLSFSLFVGLNSTGCKTKTAKNPGGSEAGHDHDHAHDHGEHGKHGGHMVHLEPTGDHAEWTHDDEKGIVSIYLEEIVAAGGKVEKVKVDLTVGDAPAKAYDFEPAPADEHKVEGSIYTIKSPELVTALEVSKGVKAVLVVTVGGKELKAALEHDHGHAH